MVFLKLVHTEYQVNHKTQSFLVKVVHLVPNAQNLAGHDVGTIRLAPTTTLFGIGCLVLFSQETHIHSRVEPYTILHGLDITLFEFL